jgi:cell division protein ZapB
MNDRAILALVSGSHQKSTQVDLREACLKMQRNTPPVIDRNLSRFYSRFSLEVRRYKMDNLSFPDLEKKIIELIEQYETLLEDNRKLKEHQEAWKAERNLLLRKNDLARTKVEAMISRLKALEQE